jgi:hypothetical protein
MEVDVAKVSENGQPTSSVTVQFAQNQVRTFAFFLEGTGKVAFNPATNLKGRISLGDSRPSLPMHPTPLRWLTFPSAAARARGTTLTTASRL